MRPHRQRASQQVSASQISAFDVMRNANLHEKIVSGLTELPGLHRFRRVLHCVRPDCTSSRPPPPPPLTRRPDLSAVYVKYFDGLINEYLVRVCGLEPLSSTEPIGLIIASNFKYALSLEFPRPILAGLAVTK